MGNPGTGSLATATEDVIFYLNSAAEMWLNGLHKSVAFLSFVGFSTALYLSYLFRPQEVLSSSGQVLEWNFDEESYGVSKYLNNL